MAICESCGHEVRRLITKFLADGSLKDECEFCKPGGLHTDPAWMRAPIAMGWEAMPKMYVKSESPDGGAHYEAKDELRVDTEAAIRRPAEEAEAAEARALAKKRNDPDRLKPLTLSEVERAHRIAAACVEALQQKIDESHKQEEEQWAEAAKPLRVQ